MQQAILFTQCLQNDFVRPIGRYDTLPNLLHIGYDEARRLLGENPKTGPVARIMTWALEALPSQLQVIHLRDWHNPADPQQQPHLQMFGPHCLQDTDGAGFAFAVPAEVPANVHILNSLSLNDFERTQLAELLEPYRGMTIPVGLTGVWTEAKIQFLAYELVTRYPEFKVGVCSALTASSSRTQHFLALDQLRRILGVQIFDSVGAFIRFLGGAVDELPLPPVHYGEFPALRVDGTSALDEQDTSIIRYLFRQSREVHARVLDGGFSGNVVLGTESTDTYGHREVAHVVKIGPGELIGRERSAFERVESVLGNSAPRIVEFVDLEKRGAIKYRYASMDGGFSTTLQKLYMGGFDAGKVQEILQSVFVEQLGRFYAAASIETVHLLDYYSFSPAFAPNVRARIEALLGARAAGDELPLFAGTPVSNICNFYERDLPTLVPRPGDTAYFSYVHGDLNGANIIVDGRQNVWLIDFFHTHRGHVLRDLIKLENDLLYIFTPLLNEGDLAEACLLSDRLCEIQDLAAPLPPLTGVSSPQLHRAYETLRYLRSLYSPLIQSDRDPLQWFIAAMRYAVHTLGFDESSGLQKKWALYTASRASGEIVARHKSSGQLRIFWLHLENAPAERVGMTILPGRRDIGRDLTKDLAILKREGVSHVVCLVPQHELEQYDVPDLLRRYKECGLEVLHAPIPDQAACTVEAMRETVQWIGAAASAGHAVLIHCVGGLGRTGMAAACYARSRGLSADEAIQAVRRARSERAIETEAQEQLVQSFVQH